MLDVAEQLAVRFLGQHVAPRVDALLVQQILVEQMVAHLVGRVAQQYVGFFERLGDSLQADGDAVAAEDGEGQPHRVGPEFGGAVLGDGVGRDIVALTAGDHGLRDRYDVFVREADALLLAAGKDGVGDDPYQVVSLADDGAAYAAGGGADSSHNVLLLFYQQDIAAGARYRPAARQATLYYKT